MGSPCSRYIVEKKIKKTTKGIREKEAVLAIREHREPKMIRDFHPHTLRHTFATRYFENKMEPKVGRFYWGILVSVLHLISIHMYWITK